MREFKGFYTKAIDDENSITVQVPADGYTMNENVSCSECSHYYFRSGSYGDTESCKHPENTHYTYDYKGKHRHIIWQPYNKNVRLDCEFWEQKKTFMQKIKIKLGFSNDN